MINMIKLKENLLTDGDIEKYLINLTKLSSPITGSHVFPQEKPLHVEIGCGNGHFLTARSQNHPENNYIGVDYSRKRVYKSIYKAKQRDIENIRFIQGEGKDLLGNHFAPESIDTLYLNFPDPWPKRKHHKNRIYQNEFFDLLHEKLKSGSIFYAVSDNESYFMELLSLLERDKRFNNDFSSRFQTELTDYEPSLYESRWREMGRTIFYLRYKKQ